MKDNDETHREEWLPTNQRDQTKKKKQFKNINKWPSLRVTNPLKYK